MKMEKNEVDGGATSGENKNHNVNKSVSGPVTPDVRVDFVETPLGLRQLGKCGETRDFSGFKEETTNMRRIVNVEKEIRLMKEVIAGILEKQEQLVKDNSDLKMKCCENEKDLKKMEQWKGEVEEKIQVLCNICGAVGGDSAVEGKVNVNDVNNSLEKVMMKMDEMVGENVALKEQIKEYEEQVKEVKETSGWTVVGRKKVEALEDIIKEQKSEMEKTKNGFENAVVGVMKKKESVVREALDRDRSVILYGDVEEHVKDFRERKVKDLGRVKNVMKGMDEDGYGWDEKVEEVIRLGKYKEEDMRPMRVQFSTRAAAESIINYSWRLNLKEKTKHLRLRKDLSVEQRKKIKELQAKADEENGKLDVEERRKFFWRVREGQIRKWYINTGGRTRAEKDRVTETMTKVGRTTEEAGLQSVEETMT